ncbi:MAG: UvrD-helicase domain-containing protein, partial [Ktedonobacterales bacterium]
MSTLASNLHASRYAPRWDAIQAICADLNLELQPTIKDGTMLGGASARLQLCDWEDPTIGGGIWYDGALEETQRLFAVAHELGHYSLHRGEGVALHPPCDAHAIDERGDSALALRADAIPNNRVEGYTPRARRELEANAFAAELLAPCSEVRRLFLASPACTISVIAAHFGISDMLAQRRLVESVLCADLPAMPAPATHLSVEEPAGATVNTGQDYALAAHMLLDRLDPSQRAAATAQGPALVVAGPGAGKTATLVGHVAYLVGKRSAQPEHVLALTFSNRAAGEMRERLMAAGLPGERMPVLTIHAFAASLLREYAARVPVGPDELPLRADFRILDATDAFLLLEELLPDLNLHYYRSLAMPTRHLRDLDQDFSQARNQLWTPADYLKQVEAMPLAPAQIDDDGAGETGTGSRKTRKKPPQKPPAGTFTREQIARARERANAYVIWDRALRQRSVMDYGSLILRTVELLRSDAAALAEVQLRYPHVLVDEFQDTNVAAWELLALVAGVAGAGLWVVGDRNQAIYRWRGASPRNLRRLVERYPALTIVPLDRNYRSTPNLVQLGVSLAAGMAEPHPQPCAPLLRGAGEPASQTFLHAGSSVDEGADVNLRAALAPGALTAARQALTPGRPDILRREDFADADHERAGIAEAIRWLHAQGYAYGDQAILYRTRKQVAQMAHALTEQGIPVAEVGNLFAQEAVKDTLTFLALAAGPDGRALLRANQLLPAFGVAAIPTTELRRALRLLADKRLPLPWALLKPETHALLCEAGVGEVSCQSLAVLAQAANDAGPSYGAIFTYQSMDKAPPSHISEALVSFLLRPAGYAWRLARIADGDQCGIGESRVEVRSARLALAALGELAGIALRFDIRWTSEPGFRARLIKATRHKRRSRPMPETPDTAQHASFTAPAADAAPAGEADSLADVAIAQPAISDAATDMVNPVACFLHYIDALRGSDGEPTIATGADDAVRILTLHGSKGLEFP